MNLSLNFGLLSQQGSVTFLVSSILNYHLILKGFKPLLLTCVSGFLDYPRLDLPIVNCRKLMITMFVIIALIQSVRVPSGVKGS